MSAWIIIVMTFLTVLGEVIWGLDYERKSKLFVNGQPTDKAKHFTYLFNTFVFMHIFNEINCRKVGAKSFNIFSGITNNWLFLAVISFTVAVQFLFVTYIPRVV